MFTVLAYLVWVAVVAVCLGYVGASLKDEIE